MENRAKERAIELANKFKIHAYPFASGSGYLTGERDENAQFNHACEIAIIAQDLIIEYLSNDGYPPEVKFQKDVRKQLENHELPTKK